MCCIVLLQIGLLTMDWAWISRNGMSIGLQSVCGDFMGTSSTGRVASTARKSSLINIRAGLNRHFNSPPWNRQITLTRDRGFQTCYQVLTGILCDFRERGLDVTQHKKALTAGDVKHAYSSGTLDNEDQVSLQLEVYFEIALHCARRGCEGLRELRRDRFVVKVDENDREYVTIRYHELEKNHQGLNKREQVRDPRMHAQNDDNCPVISFRKYVSVLNPNCEAFFQRTNPQFNDSGIWYQNAPLGKNKIAQLMKSSSKKAGLSKLYINHCLRVTSVTVLSRNDVCAENICSVTGHQDVNSVRAYVENLRMISGSTWVGIFMAMGSPPHLLPTMQSPWPPPPLCLSPRLGVPCHLWNVHHLRVNQLLFPWMTVQPVRPVCGAAKACLNGCQLMHKTLTSRSSHIRYFRVSTLLQIAIQCLTLTLPHAKFHGNISGRKIQVKRGVVVREQFRIEHCT